jgi:hypothetical protein
MKCPYGKLASVVSFGIISETEVRKDICNVESILEESQTPEAVGKRQN